MKRGPIQSLGRISGSALRVHHALQQHPIQTITTAKDRTGLTVPTATAAMKSLEGAGIVRELAGKQRGRVFGCHRCLEVLNEGTTTPPRRQPSTGEPS